jgi:membrane protease YdiL (CAAX protease family)
LLVAHVGLWGCLSVVVFFDAGPRPLCALGAILGLALPAVLITAANGGRDSVLDLLARTVRWRVGIMWHLAALIAVPLGSLLLAVLLGGAAVVDAVGEHWGLLLAVFLPQLLLNLVTVQLFEELAWSGFDQHHLQASVGAMKAALLLGLAFATVHFPMYLIGLPLTKESVLAALGLQVIVIPMALCIRLLFAWLYNSTRFSIPLAAILHASFNASNSPDFLPSFVDGGTASMLPLVVVAITAIGVAIGTKSKLGYVRSSTSDLFAASTEPACRPTGGEPGAYAERASGDVVGGPVASRAPRPSDGA